ncbi:group II intron maturase-specific domain-containing protein [uncultured Robinsoniella sp.]|uniref:group II intron maturase-specific domain-containing protein n=1 Tax=uncultured Robinsoniella sp. TaxID=904190 RepID=UPI00374F1449
MFIKCKDNKVRHNFIALVSNASSKNFRDKVKAMETHKKTGCKIDIIAEILNPFIRGWMNYFGRFNTSAMKGSKRDIINRSAIKC